MGDDVDVHLAQYWKTFTQLKKVLLKNVSVLSVIMFLLIFQVISVEFFVEEQLPSACNYTHRCPYKLPVTNGNKTKALQINPNFLIDFKRYKLSLVTAHFVSMGIGILSLGFLADRFGRKIVLFGSLVLVFVSSLLSSFFILSIKTFILMRVFAAFGSGGALLAMFVLAAEYANTPVRPQILIALWLAGVLSVISFVGLAYAISSRKILLILISFPLIKGILFYRIIPESPRWLLLQTGRKVSSRHDNIQDNESKTLLHAFTSEEVSHLSKRSACCYGYNKKCINFFRNKKQCLNLVVVGVSWFAVGMSYRGFNTSYIQLLNNYYANYVVRELVSLLAFAFSVFFATCTGRRITTVLSMVLCGIICLLFSFGSHGFFLSEQGAIKIVVQFVGRMFFIVSITSLSLYSTELFPTVIRCSALGIVVCSSFLGASTTPLIMKHQSTNPMMPLAILGSVLILVAISLRIFLPETKGALTAEGLEDTEVGRRMPLSEKWRPRVAIRKKDNVDGSSQERMQHRSYSDPVGIEEEDGQFKDLGKSWDVSFDRASCTSKWEWLSYDDARRKLPSLDLEDSLQDVSELLDDSDLVKLHDYVPGNSWILLYSTYEHGTSLKTLYHRLQEIETPVLIAIKDHQDYVFGVFSSIPPHVQKGFFGIGKSFFFKCKPGFKLYPNSGQNEYYLYCEGDSLAFGCSQGTFGLWLDGDLYRGRSTPCTTFNSDVLSSSEDFYLIGLEVWTFA